VPDPHCHDWLPKGNSIDHPIIRYQPPLTSNILFIIIIIHHSSPWKPSFSPNQPYHSYTILIPFFLSIAIPCYIYIPLSTTIKHFYSIIKQYTITVTEGPRLPGWAEAALMAWPCWSLEQSIYQNSTRVSIYICLYIYIYIYRCVYMYTAINLWLFGISMIYLYQNSGSLLLSFRRIRVCSLKRLSPGSISTDDPNIDLYIDSHQCEYL
jgi:hypothetical protein